MKHERNCKLAGLLNVKARRQALLTKPVLLAHTKKASNKPALVHPAAVCTPRRKESNLFHFASIAEHSIEWN
jgi:hypothetical protein